MLASPQLELFEVLREARNVHVHAGGVVGDRLARARAGLSQLAADGWARVAGSALPEMREADQLPPGIFDPVAAIYAIGNLSIEVNRRVTASGIIDLGRWADIAVRDYRIRNSRGWSADRDTRVRRAQGHPIVNFGAAIPEFQSDEDEIRAAVFRAPADVRLP